MGALTPLPLRTPYWWLCGDDGPSACGEQVAPGGTEGTELDPRIIGVVATEQSLNVGRQRVEEVHSISVIFPSAVVKRK
jgi:hypothetical protein